MGESLRTKTVAAPDGSPIHYPDLPNLGEQFRPRDPSVPESPAQARGTASPLPASQPQAAAHNETFRGRFFAAVHAAASRLGAYGTAAANALVLDDWRALTGSRSTPLERIEGGAALGSWAIPEGKIADLASHAIAKAYEAATAHLTAASLEHGGVAAAGAVASRGIRRPLTDAERSGHFQSGEDFRAFMGPATEPGGPARDWHHVVEKVHADGTGQFPAERIHSIDNIVPVPRDAHQLRNGLTFVYGTKDPDLGTSLRERLAGRPWEEHVFRGERTLEQAGLDPAALRTETRLRFEQRLADHEKTAPPHTLGVVAGASNGWTSPSTGADVHVSRNGSVEGLSPGQRFEGSIRSIDGDRVVQNLGRGQVATWSRAELATHFQGADGFNAVMQPGNLVGIGMDRSGAIDIQQRLPDHSWQSLSAQSLLPQLVNAIAHTHGH